MKVIIILDQIQAGLGGKERADTPYGGKKLLWELLKTLRNYLSKIIVK